MQQYTSPGEVAVGDDANLTQSVFQTADAYPNRPALSRRVGSVFQDTSAKQFADEITAVAAGLIAMGVAKGDRVCLFASTRYEWTLLDYAIWAAGAVTVPIYETSAADQVEWIVSNSEAVAIFCENDKLKGVFDSVAGQLPGCKHVFVIDDGAVQKVSNEAGDIGAEQVRERAASVVANDVATIVYTSGTTGRPKGCVITHRSFVWDAAQVASAAGEFFRPGSSTLLFLPLAHIFARVIQVGCVQAGVRLGFSTGIPHLMEELGIFRPDFILAVPRVFEKVYNGAKQKSHDAGKGKIFDAAAATAIEWSQKKVTGKVDFVTNAKHAVFDKLVYGKLRAAMGGNVQYAVSGGAALGERLGHFYNGIGVLILEGYGLTETTAGACINTPTNFKIGSVGLPVPGGTVGIADDGEILLRGAHVFEGYYKNPEATAEAIDADGWFHTGDLGKLDAEHYLYITGRKKEILVTAGGKNVAPAVLEDRLRAHPLVSQAMVVGDGQPFIAALVTIDAEAFPAWAERTGLAGKSVADLVEDAALKAEVQSAIDDANGAVSKAESIRTFRILPVDFEVGDELSQKQSVKRHVVGTKYAAVIDDIYKDVKRV